MDLKSTDPVIIDLLNWLKENLPPDVDEEDVFKKVRRVQKLFDTLISMSFQEFYNATISLHRGQKDEDVSSSPPASVDDDTSSSSPRPTPKQENQQLAKITSLEDMVSSRLEEMKEYICLNEEKRLKTKKLDASTAKLDLKKEQHKLIKSIRLESCMDLISRYNHLMSKK